MKASPAPTRVFIVEDSEPVRARLLELVTEIAGTVVVGSAARPAAAVASILQTEPDCVVLDFQLEGGTGLDVLNAVHARLPGTAFIVLTNYPQPQIRSKCIAAGASAFLDKSTEFTRVKDLIARLQQPERSTDT